MKTKNIVLGIVVLLIVGFFLKPYITGNAVSSGGEVTIPLSEISETAKFYDYTISGKAISFFIVKASDGTIKTAFDACDVCYGSKKGYRQEGEMMICNNCGNRYPIEGLGTENLKGGGCWPGYLESNIVGDNLVIKESDIKKGAYRF